MALARIDPRYGVASTAGRADAFLLPDSLQFAEYNAESPAGPGYSQRLAELFDGEPLMERFREAVRRPLLHADHRTCSTRCSRATRTGAATRNLPRIAIVDWREVPTWSEFELLRDAFADAGVADRDLRSARPGLRRTDADRQRHARRSGLPARPHQRHRRAARRVPRAASTRTGPARSAWPTACAARFRTRRRSSPC